jgi:hypothetical protein
VFAEQRLDVSFVADNSTSCRRPHERDKSRPNLVLSTISRCSAWKAHSEVSHV